MFVKPKVERRKRRTPEPESSDDGGVTILRATSTSRLRVKPQRKREQLNDSAEPHYIQYEKQFEEPVVKQHTIKPSGHPHKHHKHSIDRPNKQVPMPISDPSEHESSIRENCADVYVQKLTASRSFVKASSRNI